jgi:chaperone required for assembly of F1-ATPase
MVDILSDFDIRPLLSDPDPVKRAQKQMKTPMVKRFYKDVTVGEHGDEFVILLDGRPLKTPAKKLFAFPTHSAAALIAAEYDAQVVEINPAKMQLTRLANTAVDGVATELGAVIADMQKFAGSDLLCYRSEGPERLVERQAASWDRYLQWSKSALGAEFKITAGIMPVEQDPQAVAAIGAALRMFTHPLAIASLHQMTSLTGSVILALAVGMREVTATEAWTAAHVDEDWGLEMWGADDDAAARKAYRWLDMEAADKMLKAVQ